MACSCGLTVVPDINPNCPIHGHLEKEHKDKMLHDILRAKDLLRWAIEANDMESVSMWAGDLFDLALKGAGISIDELKQYLREHPNRATEV